MIQDLRHIDLWYDSADSQQTALRLVLTLFPDWEDSKDTIEFVHFTDGITNTVCKGRPQWHVHRQRHEKNHADVCRA